MKQPSSHTVRMRTNTQEAKGSRGAAVEKISWRRRHGNCTTITSIQRYGTTSAFATTTSSLRRTRRHVEHAQPPRQREPALVGRARQHTGPRWTTHRAATRRRPYLLPRLDGPRRPPLLAVLGERSQLVEVSSPPEHLVRALRESQTRPSRTDAPRGGVPRRTHR
jgi:hypothetical protein